MTRPTDSFQSDTLKLSQREVVMSKCISVFSYSIHRKNKNIKSLAFLEEADIGND